MKTYILGYPRSGSSYVRYFLEVVTKKPNIDFYFKTPIKKHFPELELNSDDIFTTKFHHYSHFSDNPDRLIFLLRDYKAVILSHFFKHHRKQKNITDEFLIFLKNRFVVEYMNLLNFYDKFKNKKIIMYYNDIKENNFFKLISFLALKNTNEFFKNIKYHNNKSLKQYRNNTNTVNQKDMELTIDEYKKIRSFLINMDKYLYNKYLRRYDIDI